MTTNNTNEIATATPHVEAFIKTHDTIHVAENAVFKNFNTGQETIGREAIGQMLHYFYHIAFDARAIIKNVIVTEDKAVLEATFSGRHIGEFANIAPTNKEVNVPMCVAYDLNEEGLIQEGRIYMLMDVMFQQLQSS
jgi:predicted ester cyclase